MKKVNYCRKLEVLGFKMVVIGENPYLSKQTSITIPGGLTLLAMYSNRYGFSLWLNSDSKISPRWGKKLLEFQ